MDRNVIICFVIFLIIWQQTINLQWLYVLNNQRRLRRWWLRPVNRTKRLHGFQHNLLEELWNTDHREFFEVTRMWPEHFTLLHNLCEEHLKKKFSTTASSIYATSCDFNVSPPVRVCVLSVILNLC